MLVLFFCLLYLTAAAAEVGLDGKVLLFPSESTTSYVNLTPKEPLSLTAFTLCMRVAMELQGERKILFSYDASSDVLSVWREKDGRLSLYIRSSENAAFFPLPPLSSFQTHLCVTWESKTGFTAFWVNGRRGVYQVYRKDLSILPDGVIQLGQYAVPNAQQSFVGEITDLHMWDYVLSGTQIKAMYSCNGLNVSVGNLLDWNTMNYEIAGNVLVVKK